MDGSGPASVGTRGGQEEIQRGDHGGSAISSARGTPAQNLLNSVMLFLFWGRPAKHFGIDNISKRLVENTHIEIKTLVNHSSRFRILRVERVVLAVLIDQIGCDGPRFIQL